MAFSVISALKRRPTATTGPTAAYCDGKDGYSGHLTQSTNKPDERPLTVKFTYDPVRELFIKPDGSTTTEEYGEVK